MDMGVESLTNYQLQVELHHLIQQSYSYLSKMVKWKTATITPNMEEIHNLYDKTYRKLRGNPLNDINSVLMKNTCTVKGYISIDYSTSSMHMLNEMATMPTLM